MISSAFVLLAALGAAVSPGAHALSRAGERREAPPNGFRAVDFAALEETITLRFALPERDFDGLEKALYAAASPSSGKFGQYLTKEEVSSYAAPSEESLSAVTSWLESNGLALGSQAGNWISVKATIEQANHLLQADFKKYEHESLQGPVTRSLMYSIPEDVSPHIAAVHPTVVFPDPRPAEEEAPLGSEGLSGSEARRAAEFDFGPGDLPPSCIPDPNDQSYENLAKPWGLHCALDRYGIPYVPAGPPIPGNDLWISGFDNMFVVVNTTRDYVRAWRPDLDDYTTKFDLVTITGGLNNQLPWGHYLINTASMGIAQAISPNTPITFMSVGTEESLEDWVVWFIDQVEYLLNMEHPPRVLVHGWPQENESRIDPNIASALCASYAQLAARGVTMLHAIYMYGVGNAWDDPPCTKFDVPFPASCPYVTSVGGSYVDLEAASGPSEVVFGANSGGFSNYFTRPSYQESTVPAYLEAMKEYIDEELINISGRAVPDVVLSRDLILTPDARFERRSTVYSTSILAGMVALLNDELVAAGKSPIGFLNPLLYENPDALLDLTIGRNDGCGFNATVGWDPAAGLGCPIYPKLRSALGL